ncbi:MAG: InlB B-repeat-containing protein [Prevotella sp.]|nr:InlB B-repeat-containing protein [Candidatus Prevotella equi]
MKRLILSLSVTLLFTLSAIAQISGDGYYRIVNAGVTKKEGTAGYASVTYRNFNQATSSLQNIEPIEVRTNADTEDIGFSDPSTILYISNPFDPSKFDIKAQGASVRSMVNGTMTLGGSQGSYTLTGTQSGMSAVIYSIGARDEYGRYYLTNSKTEGFQKWYVYPVDNTKDQLYIGIKPTLTVTKNGVTKYYAPYYVSYPFKPLSSGMKVYYVSSFDNSSYELKELTGIVPASTPVLVECSSPKSSDNRITLYAPGTTGTSAADNKLKGQYFFNKYMSVDTYTDARIIFDATTMRIWDVVDGKLVLSNSTASLPTDRKRKKCLNPNISYLVVPTTASATLTSVDDKPHYTVTFDTDGGSAIAPVTDVAGKVINAPATNPTKTGYTFDGWDTTFPITLKDQNITVTAKWKINSYTITFNSNGGSTVDAITKNYGEAITAPSNPTRTGYTFDGWDKQIPTTMPAESQTITAQWKINSYTITFNSNGGSVVSAITKNYGEAITAPSNPTRTGYTFDGWDKTIPTTMPAESQTITAKWKINSYTITFNSNGGSAVGAITKNYGEAITAPSNPTRTGYTFDGWDKPIPTTMPAESRTITAQWKINSYTITFDSNGGSAVSAITKNYGEAITAPSNPTRTGYTFDGWDKPIPTTMPAESQTITAKWKINSYTITFNSNGGSTVDAITKNYGEAITAPSNPTRTGYTFDGWDKTIPTTMPAESQTITAQWKINQYNVTFVGDDGTTVIRSGKQDYGSTITAPADPTKTGADFIGWSPNVDTVVPDHDVTYKATFSDNDFTITFNTAGGSEVNPIVGKYGSTVTAPSDPSRLYYDFVAWDKPIPTTMPAENLTITAQWKKQQGKKIALEEGWNWTSFNVVSDDLDDMKKVLSTGSWKSGDEIKNAEYIAAYSEKANGWIGSMRDKPLSNTAMYKVRSNKQQTLVLSGEVMIPSETDIVVKQGWNYISYLPIVDMSISEALTEYNAEKDDMIKSLDGTAVYNGSEWVTDGKFETLTAGKGYMLYRTSPRDNTFRFPDDTKEEKAEAKKVAACLYPDNMSIIASIDGVMTQEGDTVVAMAKGQWRGATAVKNDGSVLLTVQGSDKESVDIALLRGGNIIAVSNAAVEFSSDAIVGSVSNPAAIVFADDADSVMLPGTVVAVKTLDGKSCDTNISALPKGVYLVQCECDGKIITKKITK